MADLSELQSSLSVKVAGSSLSGVETNYVAVDASGAVQINPTLNTGGQYRAQSVTTTAGEALGAATILTNRKLLTITPTTGVVYWGYNSSVTTANGTPIFKNQTLALSASDIVHIYLIAASTIDCRISEGA